ncbi:hypothetical protein COJ07_21105 [Bacillus cereus]|nr:hypothetical protein COJ07_21105 [Bacillus cereus]
MNKTQYSVNNVDNPLSYFLLVPPWRTEQLAFAGCSFIYDQRKIKFTVAKMFQFSSIIFNSYTNFL